MLVKVLILQVDPEARKLLSRVVRDSFSDRLQISEAGDLDTARQLLSMNGGAREGIGDEPFKLLLIDLLLPDGHAIALLTELAQYPATKVVQALHPDDERLLSAVQCGADGYLLMGNGFQDLAEEIQKIARGQPPISPALAMRMLSHFDAGNALTAAGRLTARENEVLSFLAKGFTIKEIAHLLNIKWFAVNDEVKSIYRKLNRGPQDDGSVGMVHVPKPTGGSPLASSATTELADGEPEYGPPARQSQT
jgi:two-component system, NarL family, nitrate/nitrite response regulator NarL